MISIFNFIFYTYIQSSGIIYNIRIIDFVHIKPITTTNNTTTNSCSTTNVTNTTTNNDSNTRNRMTEKFYKIYSKLFE